MADEHVFTLIFEASGEVTPAEKVTPAEPEPGSDTDDTDDNDTTEPEPEEAEQ